MHSINHLPIFTQYSGNICYARFDEVGSVDSEPERLIIHRGKKHLEVLAVHDRLVVVMMQRQRRCMLARLFAQIREQMGKAFDVGTRETLSRLAVAKDNTLGAYSLCKCEDSTQRSDTCLIKQPLHDQSRGNGWSILPPLLNEALRVVNIPPVLTLLEL